MSAFANVNGAAILRGIIERPLTGLWTADLILTDSSAIVNPVTLTIGDLVMIGAVVRSASFSGARSVRLVGGSGGWRQQISRKWYDNGVLFSQVLNDLARETGETVSLVTDQSLGSYTREDGPASRVLNAIVGPDAWYVREDGATVIGGTRDASEISSPFDVMAFSGALGRWELATENYAEWTPGRTFTSNLTDATIETASAVVHHIDRGKVRTEVLTTP